MRSFGTPLVVWLLLLGGGTYERVGKKNVSLQLSHCLSESFDEKQCVKEVQTAETTYPNYSAPDDLIMRLSSAYHNLAYVSPPGAVRDAWAHKEKILFDTILSGATTAQRLYLASTIAPTLEAREECLSKALAVDPSFSLARRDLIRTLLNSKDITRAIAEWRVLNKSSSAHDVDALDGIRLANLAAAKGDLNSAHEIIAVVMSATAGLDSVARCQLLKTADLPRLQLDQATLATIKDIRQVCEDVQHRNNAVEALRRGDKAQAEAELKAQIRENPRYLEAYLLLEDLYRSTGRSEQAARVVKALFRADVAVTEKCAAISHLPLQAYGGQSADLIEEKRKMCQR